MKVNLIKCECQHQYQDEKYGKAVRVHNESKDGKKNTCTVCGKTK